VILVDEACAVERMQLLQPIANVTTRVGDPALDSTQFVLSMTPEACPGLQVSWSATPSLPFLTAQPGNQRFTVEASGRQVGVFTVVVAVSATKAAATGIVSTFATKFTFVVTIQPCILSQLSPDSTQSIQYAYQIGNGTLTTKPFRFVQLPVCGYEPS